MRLARVVVQLPVRDDAARTDHQIKVDVEAALAARLPGAYGVAAVVAVDNDDEAGASYRREP